MIMIATTIIVEEVRSKRQNCQTYIPNEANIHPCGVHWREPNKNVSSKLVLSMMYLMWTQFTWSNKNLISKILLSLMHLIWTQLTKPNKSVSSKLVLYLMYLMWTQFTNARRTIHHKSIKYSHKRNMIKKLYSFSSVGSKETWYVGSNLVHYM